MPPNHDILKSQDFDPVGHTAIVVQGNYSLNGVYSAVDKEGRSSIVLRCEEANHIGDALSLHGFIITKVPSSRVKLHYEPERLNIAQRLYGERPRRQRVHAEFTGPVMGFAPQTRWVISNREQLLDFALMLPPLQLQWPRTQPDSTALDQQTIFADLTVLDEAVFVFDPNSGTAATTQHLAAVPGHLSLTTSPLRQLGLYKHGNVALANGTVLPNIDFCRFMLLVTVGGERIVGLRHGAPPPSLPPYELLKAHDQSSPGLHELASLREAEQRMSEHEESYDGDEGLGEEELWRYVETEEEWEALKRNDALPPEVIRKSERSKRATVEVFSTEDQRNPYTFHALLVDRLDCPIDWLQLYEPSQGADPSTAETLFQDDIVSEALRNHAAASFASSASSTSNPPSSTNMQQRGARNIPSAMHGSSADDLADPHAMPRQPHYAVFAGTAMASFFARRSGAGRDNAILRRYAASALPRHSYVPFEVLRGSIASAVATDLAVGSGGIASESAPLGEEEGPLEDSGRATAAVSWDVDVQGDVMDTAPLMMEEDTAAMQPPLPPMANTDTATDALMLTPNDANVDDWAVPLDEAMAGGGHLRGFVVDSQHKLSLLLSAMEKEVAAVQGSQWSALAAGLGEGPYMPPVLPVSSLAKDPFPFHRQVLLAVAYWEDSSPAQPRSIAQIIKVSPTSNGEYLVSVALQPFTAASELNEMPAMDAATAAFAPPVEEEGSGSAAPWQRHRCTVHMMALDRSYNGAVHFEVTAAAP